MHFAGVCARQLWCAVEEVAMSKEVAGNGDRSNVAADFQVAGTSLDVERVSVAGKKRLFADVETDRTFGVYSREHEGLLPCPYQVPPFSLAVSRELSCAVPLSAQQFLVRQRQTLQKVLALVPSPSDCASCCFNACVHR